MKILYAVRVGDADWQEEIITEHEQRIPQAKAWAEANGFDRFRIATFSDEPEPPEFGANLLNL